MAAAETTAPAAEETAARVYVDGVFDLFHTGHLEFLRKARAVGGEGAVLVVGVIGDGDAGWKRRPVVPHVQRVEMLRCCRLADEIVEDPPLRIDEAFLAARRIDLVVHGDDDLQEEFFRIPRRLGLMRYVPYAKDGPLAASTTALIARIDAREN